jgi:hypothetical protein
MKKHFLALSLAVAMLVGFNLNASAQRNYVNERPVVHATVKTAKPSSDHKWVADEYAYRGGKYEQVPGHWEVPPAGHKKWIAGHWEKEEGHGHFWVPGTWR